MIRILSVFFVLTLFVSPALAKERVSRATDIKQTNSNIHAMAVVRTLSGWLPGQLKEREIPGAAVAVVDRQAVVWEQTWGVTDGSDSAPISPDTLFNIRSISKSVTARGVLMATQEIRKN